MIFCYTYFSKLTRILHPTPPPLHPPLTPAEDLYNLYSTFSFQLYHKLGLKDKVQYALQLAFDACDKVRDYEGTCRTVTVFTCLLSSFIGCCCGSPWIRGRMHHQTSFYPWKQCVKYFCFEKKCGLKYAC